MFVLEVLSGPLDGKIWPFEDEITIGRDDATACIALDRYISRRHASIRARGDQLTLEDLESRNGTHVGADARTVSETSLQLGERFMVGRTLLRVRPA